MEVQHSQVQLRWIACCRVPADMDAPDIESENFELMKAREGDLLPVLNVLVLLVRSCCKSYDGVTYPNVLAYTHLGALS